jgi:cellulose synthase/poly-beta-1,6-N-acetylglucosamine synthase-like glycosyltransferase
VTAPAAPRLPRVSVLVAARNEAAVMERRLANLLEQDYPPDRLEVLVVSDASDDGTDQIVQASRDPRVKLVRQPDRAGKTAGINIVAPLASGDLLVQTDANVLFSRGAVRALAAAFADPSVGVAVGEVLFSNADNPEVASGEGLYWRFETWVKKVESDRALLAVANGGIYALRRELWRPLPPTISGDAAEPLLAAAQGLRTVIAPDALAHERAAETLSEEFSRKARIIAQQVACARWLGWRRLPPRIAWAYASHKLLRYVVPFLALIAALAAGLAAWAGSWAGGVLAALTVLPALLAPLGLLSVPGPLGRILRTPLYLLVVNMAAIAGLWRGLAGRAPAVWEVPVSTRSPATGAASDGPRV